MKNRFIGYLFIGIASLLMGLSVGFLFGYDRGYTKVISNSVTSFEECAAAGYPIMEIYPEQCITPEGNVFIREIEEGNDSSEPITGCTMEAKICPDGSSVGRTLPNCEFAPCPGE